uniref:Protein kinase domain-containing protein n=1 Tax=Bursaphelenchus xylophilus TaxID=6326 RepID=A0A1I7SFH8_BURXY
MNHDCMSSTMLTGSQRWAGIERKVLVDTELDDLSIESVTPENSVWEEKFQIRVPKTLKKKDNPPAIVDPDEELLGAEGERKKGGEDADKRKEKRDGTDAFERMWGLEVADSKETASKERDSQIKPSKEKDSKDTASKETDSKETASKLKDSKTDSKQKPAEKKKKSHEKRKKRRRKRGNPMIYKMVDRMGDGSFGVLYRFKCKDTKFAVKFVPTADPKAMRKARTVYANFKRIHCREKRELIMHFVDIGRTLDTTYLIMPCLGRSMDTKKIEGMELKKKFILIYHYLRPIAQLQSVEIAHLNVKPKNYLNRPGTPHVSFEI